MPSPASCTHAPPAPLPSAAFRRRPLPGPALTGPRPTVTRSQGARHAAPPSRPPRADIRVTLSRCVGPGALAGKNRAVCIPFSPNALKRPSSWQHPLEMHAFRDQDGNILAPCIHFRAQSGDSGCMARESCRQGPFFASRNPKSRMARRCCQRRPAFPRQRPAVRRNGLCAMRQRHAARGMAERALRPAARAWPACRMRPPAVLLVPAAACASPPSRPRSSPPSYTCRASPPETRHAVPVPMHLATCAPHPSRQPRGPTASRKQAEQRKQLNAGIKIGSPNGDPIEELFGLRSVCPTPYSPYTKRTNLRFPTWITAPDRDSGATL